MKILLEWHPCPTQQSTHRRPINSTGKQTRSSQAPTTRILVIIIDGNIKIRHLDISSSWNRMNRQFLFLLREAEYYTICVVRYEWTIVMIDVCVWHWCEDHFGVWYHVDGCQYSAWIWKGVGMEDRFCGLETWI